MSDKSNNGPLKGIRVADFSWVLAGPLTTRVLALLGAEVIKIESIKRLDLSRGRPPFPPGKSGHNCSANFGNTNAQKRSITLNMGHPKARELAKRIIAISDVVADNFTTGVMERWGLTYEELVKVKPDVIALSMPVMGKTGPRAEYGGYGMGIEAISGLKLLWGDPERPPVGSGIAYPDMGPNPRHAMVALLAAIYHRNRTGEGQFIELAQYESTIGYTGTMILDYTCNARKQTRSGAAIPGASPHGVYRCEGEDRWCVIAVFGDEQWQRFCRAIGDPAWTGEERFASHLNRKRHERELNAQVESWTSERPPEEVMTTLQGAGLSAGIVQNGQDLIDRDPQLAARGHYARLEHPEAGTLTCDSLSFRMSRASITLEHPAPVLGQDNEYVYGQLLGMTEEELDKCYVEGILD